MTSWAHVRLVMVLAAVVAVGLVGCGTAERVGDQAAPLHVVDLKDGDSFVADDGMEYRIGLVNTPERAECGGAEAAERTQELLVEGFDAESYATDQHGRTVARITDAEGRDVGVQLAREGLADDRYLEEFRHEHPIYAAELHDAFARAREEGEGLWSRCWAEDSRTTPGPTPHSPPGPESTGPEDTGLQGHVGTTGRWACHPAYHECLPDGPDLDCADVRHQVTLLGQADPYRLDGNSLTRTDGVGCDTWPPFDADETYPYADH